MLLVVRRLTKLIKKGKSKAPKAKKAKQVEKVVEKDVEEDVVVVESKGKGKRVATDQGKITRKKPRQKLVSVDGVAKVVKINCRPEKVVELLDSLSQAQRKDVEDIGFGVLFHLKMTLLPLGIIPWLIEKFEHAAMLQNFGKGKRYVLTGDDVYDVFMLPRNPGVEVPYVFQYKGSDEAIGEMKQRWKADFPDRTTKDEVKLLHLEEKLKALVGGGDQFKRLFVLYISSFFLAPNPTWTVDLKLLNAVEDVSRTSKYDWCSFVVERWSNVVKRFKSNNYSSVSACVVVPLTCYLHRSMLRGRTIISTLPLCQHWSDKEIKIRVIAEKKVGYGESFLDTSYPISKGRFGQLSHYVPPSENNDFVHYLISDGLPKNTEIKQLAAYVIF